MLSGAAEAKAAQKRPPVSHRRGVEPVKNGECPNGYPIKGNFTTDSGERCIYRMTGQRFHFRTKAERCRETEAKAMRDGCRRSKP